MARRRARGLERFLRQLQRGLDSWFLTLAHYFGILLLLWAVAVDRLRNPGLLPAALGLILLRGVAGGDEE